MRRAEQVPAEPLERVLRDVREKPGSTQVTREVSAARGETKTAFLERTGANILTGRWISSARPEVSGGRSHGRPSTEGRRRRRSMPAAQVFVESVEARREGSAQLPAHQATRFEIPARLRAMLIDETSARRQIEEVTRGGIGGTLGVARIERGHQVVNLRRQIGHLFRRERRAPRVGTACTAMQTFLGLKGRTASVFGFSDFVGTHDPTE